MKHFTLVIALFFAVNIHAQNHPGIHPELLQGKEVKLKPHYNANATYSHFYTDENTLKRHSGKQELLLGRIFTIEKVGPVSESGSAKLTLQETGGETLYYEYTNKGEYFFDVIGGIDYPEDFFNQYITSEIAEDGYKEWSLNKNKGLTITKEINIATGKEEYEFVIHLTGSAKLDKGKGVVIYIENDKKIELPNEIVAKSHQGRYIAFVVLDKKMIDLLVNYSIKSIKLVGQTDQVPSETAIILKGGLKNLLMVK